MKPWPHGDPDVVVRAILAQPAYRQKVIPPEPVTKSLLQRLLDAIGDAWHRLFGGIHVSAHGVWSLTQTLGTVLLVLAAVGCAFLVFRIVVGMTRVRRGASGARRVTIGADASATDVRAAAADAAQRGDYARAIGLLFRASLFALDAVASIDFDPARTPGEYRRLVRTRAREASTPFDELCGRFVRASFSAQRPSRAEFDAASRALSQLDQSLAAAA